MVKNYDISDYQDINIQKVNDLSKSGYFGERRLSQNINVYKPPSTADAG
jgi:hypothetical protein